MFKKWDILLAAALLFLIGASWLLFLQPSSAAEEAYALVQVDGAEWGCYPLNEETTFAVEQEGRYNLVQIAGGKVSVTEANCGNGQCIHMGEKQDPGQMIVCLPNRVVITIEGETSEGGPDVIVR